MSLTTRLFRAFPRTRLATPATARAVTASPRARVPMSQADITGGNGLAVVHTSVRSLSSFSPIQWWQDRQQNKEAEKYKQRVHEMAQKSQWTLQDMKGELDEVVESWMARVPGLNNNKETEMAKRLHRTITGLVDIVGADATMERLEVMTRAEKLRAAAAAGTTVPELNQLIQQFSTTALMHRVLRHRRAAGRSLPETPDATQAVIQAEGRSFLSSRQKQKMARHSQKNMMKHLKRR